MSEVGKTDGYNKTQINAMKVCAFLREKYGIEAIRESGIGSVIRLETDVGIAVTLDGDRLELATPDLEKSSRKVYINNEEVSPSIARAAYQEIHESLKSHISNL